MTNKPPIYVWQTPFREGPGSFDDIIETMQRRLAKDNDDTLRELLKGWVSELETTAVVDVETGRIIGLAYVEDPDCKICLYASPIMRHLTRVKSGEASAAYTTGFMVYDDPSEPTTDEQRDAARAWFFHDFGTDKDK